MDMKDKWRQLALDLGFEFKEGIRAFTESPVIIGFMNDKIAGNPAVLQNPLFQQLMEKIFIGAATGIYREHEFFIYRETSQQRDGAAAQAYVRIVMPFKMPLDMGLKMYSADFFTRIGTKLFPGLYVKVAGKELKNLVGVKGKRKSQIQLLLAEPENEKIFVRMFDHSGKFEISDRGICCKTPGNIIDKTLASEAMNLMIEAAKIFE